MNRRSFFSRLLGAACLAVAERVMPSSIAGTVKPVFAEPDWQQWGSYRVYLPAPSIFPEGSYAGTPTNHLMELMREAIKRIPSDPKKWKFRAGKTWKAGDWP